MMMSATDTPHAPVMINEVIAGLAPRDGGIYVDGTLGAGGYSEAILSEAKCCVHAFDRDPSVATHAARLKERFGDMFHWYEDCFSNMEQTLNGIGVMAVDGITFDVGVSSMQLDQSERGFSFQKDGPLDMRMSQKGMTAADFVNDAELEELQKVIREYGEEPHAKRIARAIFKHRAEKPIARTSELAQLIERAVPHSKKRRIHPSTKTFQAIRIYINNELEELRKGLSAAERLLKPAGRLAIVVFHSLEGRIVKQFLTKRALPKRLPSRHQPQEIKHSPVEEGEVMTFKYVGKRSQKPTETEIEINPRARSARLSVVERTVAPVIH